MGRARVYVGCSLDGFIAGPNDELDWLPKGDTAEDTYTPFMAQIGALLMGRRTFDVVSGMEGPWHYGDKPVLVATTRPLVNPKAPTVRAVSGTPRELLRQARDAAGERDVYVDGGNLIRSLLEEGLVDELVVTIVPMIIGQGRPLFAGLGRHVRLELLSSRPIGEGMVQLTYRPRTGD